MSHLIGPVLRPDPFGPQEQGRQGWRGRLPLIAEVNHYVAGVWTAQDTPPIPWHQLSPRQPAGVGSAVQQRTGDQLPAAPGTAALPLEQAVAAFDTLTRVLERGGLTLYAAPVGLVELRDALGGLIAQLSADPVLAAVRQGSAGGQPPDGRSSSGWGSNSSRSGPCTTSWPAGSPPGGPNAPSPSTSRRHHTGTRPGPSKSTTAPRAGTRLRRQVQVPGKYLGRTVRVVIGLERIEVYDPATGNRIGSRTPARFTPGELGGCG